MFICDFLKKFKDFLTQTIAQNMNSCIFIILENSQLVFLKSSKLTLKCLNIQKNERKAIKLLFKY